LVELLFGAAVVVVEVVEDVEAKGSDPKGSDAKGSEELENNIRQ
jgi:hypothetical protein